jgi:hypothetical protein
MEDKVLKEAEKICEIIFQDNEVGQCLLYHHLAMFADYVEVLAIKRFRDELDTNPLPYSPEEVKHG